MSFSVLPNNNPQQTGGRLKPHELSTKSVTPTTSLGQPSATASAAPKSTQVTLSPEAQILAQLSAAGYTFTVTGSEGPVGLQDASGLNLPSQSPTESVADFASQIYNRLVENYSGYTVSVKHSGVTMGEGPLVAGASLPTGVASAPASLPATTTPANGDENETATTAAAVAAMAFATKETKLESVDAATTATAGGNSLQSDRNLLKDLSKADKKQDESPTQAPIPGSTPV